jgi:hypothetical protein
MSSSVIFRFCFDPLQVLISGHSRSCQAGSNCHDCRQLAGPEQEALQSHLSNRAEIPGTLVDACRIGSHDLAFDARYISLEAAKHSRVVSENRPTSLKAPVASPTGAAHLGAVFDTPSPAATIAVGLGLSLDTSG